MLAARPRVARAQRLLVAENDGPDRHGEEDQFARKLMRYIRYDIRAPGFFKWTYSDPRIAPVPEYHFTYCRPLDLIKTGSGGFARSYL